MCLDFALCAQKPLQSNLISAEQVKKMRGGECVCVSVSGSLDGAVEE